MVWVSVLRVQDLGFRVQGSKAGASRLRCRGLGVDGI